MICTTSRTSILLHITHNSCRYGVNIYICMYVCISIYIYICHGCVSHVHSQFAVDHLKDQVWWPTFWSSSGQARAAKQVVRGVSTAEDGVRKPHFSHFTRCFSRIFSHGLKPYDLPWSTQEHPQKRNLGEGRGYTKGLKGVSKHPFHPISLCLKFLGSPTTIQWMIILLPWSLG